MPFDATSYTIRRKILTILGAAFHVYDPQGDVIGYSKQKAFKLKEDIRVFETESMSRELLSIQARSVIDFSAAYDIVDARSQERVGVARRKGWSSLFRDSWQLLDAHEHPVATVQEDSQALAFLRRFLSNLIPQSFSVTSATGHEYAQFKQQFNPFVYRLSVSLESPSEMDPRLILGAAVLICAIEGRQQ